MRRRAGRGGLGQQPAAARSTWRAAGTAAEACDHYVSSFFLFINFFVFVGKEGKGAFKTMVGAFKTIAGRISVPRHFLRLLRNCKGPTSYCAVSNFTHLSLEIARGSPLKGFLLCEKENKFCRQNPENSWEPILKRLLRALSAIVPEGSASEAI